MIYISKLYVRTTDRGINAFYNGQRKRSISQNETSLFVNVLNFFYRCYICTYHCSLYRVNGLIYFDMNVYFIS